MDPPQQQETLFYYASATAPATAPATTPATADADQGVSNRNSTDSAHLLHTTIFGSGFYLVQNIWMN